MKTLETLKQIQEISRQNKKREENKKTRIVTKEITAFRQGDIYVFRMPNNWKVGQELERKQLADGFSIGARHVLDGEFKIYKGVKCPAFVKSAIHKRVCLGYAFDAEEGCLLTHPEHDNFLIKDKGRFQGLHQVDLMTLRRVAD